MKAIMNVISNVCGQDFLKEYREVLVLLYYLGYNVCVQKVDSRIKITCWKGTRNEDFFSFAAMDAFFGVKALLRTVCPVSDWDIDYGDKESLMYICTYHFNDLDLTLSMDEC